MQPVRDRASSVQALDINMAPGSNWVSMTSTWRLVTTDINTNTYCRRAMDPVMALSSSTDQDIIMASRGSTDDSHQTVSYHPRVSSFAFLHCAHTAPLLLVYHLSTTYLFILAAPGLLSVFHPALAM